VDEEGTCAGGTSGVARAGAAAGPRFYIFYNS
jgi:hypothetical protein